MDQRLGDVQQDVIAALHATVVPHRDLADL